MKRQFRELRERLLRAGVAPRHATRYLNELADHFADLKSQEEGAGRNRSDVESAALVRLGGIDDLVKAMEEKRQFQSWCVRAPWATFGLGPLLILAGLWLVAALVSLSGLNVPLSSPDKWAFAMHRVRLGGSLFLCAPILIGWGIGLIAARQRFRATWPTISLAVMTLVSSTCRVYFTGFSSELGGTTRLGGIGVATGSDFLLAVLSMLVLTALPYLIWRLKMARSV